MSAMQPPFTLRVLWVCTMRGPTAWSKERMQGCGTVVTRVQGKLLVKLLTKERRTCSRAWHKSMEKSFKGLMGTSLSLMMRPRPRSGGRIRVDSKRTLSGSQELRWRSRGGIMLSLINSLSISIRTINHHLHLPPCHLKKYMLSKNPHNI